MKLEIPVKVYFNDVQGMIDEVKKLQTYKLFEGDDMVLVDLDAVVAIMANHVKADKCSESPNGWIPCTPETMPDVAQRVLLSGHGEVMVGMLHSFGKYSLEPTGILYEYSKDDIDAWQPLPPAYKGE